MGDDSYPRQAARTRGFSLGVPQKFSIAEDGSRVVFVRTPAGDDPLAALWSYEVADDEERLIFDPAGREPGGSISQAELDRRERTGERLDGIAAFSIDANATIATFALAGRLVLADLQTLEVSEFDVPEGAFDPRPDPTGKRVAYVADGALHLLDRGSGEVVTLASDDDPDVGCGLAEFAAAEEMQRRRGFWWSPDGTRLIACRVDESPVTTWYIASPVDPSAPPRAVRFPQAGTANAEVTLHVLGIDGSTIEVSWDTDTFEYVAAVSWEEEGPPISLVQTRDQRDVQVLQIDPDSGDTEVLWTDHDDLWTHLTPGIPAWLPGGRLLTAAHSRDTRRLFVDGEPISPIGLHVESVLHAGSEVLFRATEEPTEMHVWRMDASGRVERLSDRPGLHTGAAGGGLTVLQSETLDSASATAVLFRGTERLHTFSSVAEASVLEARPRFASLGSRELRSAVLTPGGKEPDRPLPVLLDPYGGPLFARVGRTQRLMLESQWFADQGFVVLVADGRGTPFRGIAWEQSVYRNFIDPALEDQVEALHEAADLYGFLDLSKVAIRGWSYGGYLTIAALLRRPDVFHAGIAGAPTSDMRYYDTHYTERYLGTPSTDPEAYERANLLNDAANLRGKLLIIHGIADDNVYVAHSLRISKALMEAGRRHSMIPLSGITHRPVDEVSAENMLLIEVEFLREALGITD